MLFKKFSKLGICGPIGQIADINTLHGSEILPVPPGSYRLCSFWKYTAVRFCFQRRESDSRKRISPLQDFFQRGGFLFFRGNTSLSAKRQIAAYPRNTTGRCAAGDCCSRIRQGIIPGAHTNITGIFFRKPFEKKNFQVIFRNAAFNGQNAEGDKMAAGNVPVYMQTYEQLLKEIRDGVWKTGDRLPADMVFARKLGINHLTLKKAMIRLAAEGYLTRTRGRGTFVADVLPKAKSPVSGKRVAVIYDIVHENSFQSAIFLSIYQKVGEMGLNLELLSANRSRTTQFRQIVSLFSDSDSAGCIVWSLMDLRQLRKLAAAKPANYPLIFINHKPEQDIQGFDFSGYDDFGSGCQLGEYINSLGFERCIVCQAADYRNRMTNRQRISGLRSRLKNPPELFSRYHTNEQNSLSAFLEERKNQEKTAVVFIADTDYSASLDSLQQTQLTPFVFFTALTPCCRGIFLSCKEMGANAVRILQARRCGADDFSISHCIAGRIV